ncbi:SprB repeat-containing protein [Ekhidna sp.]|uniref:SprB repeat-containing protein n=1 Tax=Ekhidna sp. TaxID=2608089 RepID=UPI003B5C55E8
MKNLVLFPLLLSFLIYMGCSNNSEEDTEIDCESSDLELQATNIVNPDCDTEGSFTLEATGGTSPYSYSLDDGDFQSSGEFSNLVAKTYTVAVTDADGCTFQGTFALEAGPNGISLSIDKTNSSCTSNTGTITVNASGGDGSFTYSLDGGTDQVENSFENIGAGDYEVTVTDGTGCSATTSVKILTTISLEGDIMPLLQANCVVSGCHNGDNSCGSSCNWSVKTNVLEKASEIKSRTGSGVMPPAGSGQSLTQAEIDMIACWVDDGALDN